MNSIYAARSLSSAPTQVHNELLTVRLIGETETDQRVERERRVTDPRRPTRFRSQLPGLLCELGKLSPVVPIPRSADIFW